MKWSISVGRLFGIQLRIHLTFFLLLAFIFASVFAQHGLNAAIMSALFICAIFACVIIHEVGHSLIARRFGKEPKSITLLPIGGMVEVEEMPRKPAQEIAIALVGPFINLVIAGILYLLTGPDVKVGLPTLYPDSGAAFIGQLIGINIMLAAFNLLPAFPMDGGRVLRGLLAMKLNYVRATKLAAGFGQTIAAFFVFFGLFNNWWLAIIGIFLYLGAGAESRQVVLQSLLAEVGAGEAMTTEYISLRPGDSLAAAIEHFHHGCQQDFPVIGDSGVVGILTRDRILASIHTKGLDARVDEVMDKNFAVVEANMGLDQVYRILRSGNKTAVVVMDGGRLKGIISMDGISRYFMVKAALKGTDVAG
ncbi:MAG: site-2 protease family protein [Sedimentisphaerales bacterium]|nr:site-2 protease family protein [Sedimentisphaerales bacterium]